MSSHLVNFKKDGFEGQRAIVIPKPILTRFCTKNDAVRGAYITDIGYYPKAKFHGREREAGAEENILIYCIDGKGTVDINSVTYDIAPGDFIVIPHNTKHFYETNESSPWTIYWCHFKGPQSDAIVEQIFSKEQSYRYSVKFVDERINLFDKLYSFLEQGYSTENLTYVNLLLLQYLCSFAYRDRFYAIKPETHAEPSERSILFMQNNLDKGLSLAELAASVNLSISHYTFLFKKKTGFSPIDYFNHLKIQKACQYLQFTDLRISEIAFKVGIDDQFYFSRLFTRTMGYGPKEYRKSRSAVK
jgi:AraC-like DNA-binding protein